MLKLSEVHHCRAHAEIFLNQMPQPSNKGCIKDFIITPFQTYVLFFLVREDKTLHLGFVVLFWFFFFFLVLVVVM